MPYDLQLPNGVLLQDIPDDIPDSEIRKRVLKEYPDIAAKSKRTWKEAGSDVLASLETGAGQLAQLPGQVGALAGISKPEESSTGLQGLGQRLEAYGQEGKSEILKAKEAARAQKMQQAEGFVNEFGTAIKSTITDPALLSSFFFEQIPNLIGTGGFGAIGRGGAKVLMRNATEEALGKAGVGGAVAGGAIMQGADIGSDTYDQIYAELKKQNPNMPDAEAQGIALSKGRMAAIEAAGISLAATRLPGGTSVERALAGKGLPGTGGFIKGLGGEALSEGVEEGGGALAKNYNVQQVFPETELMKGVGSAAGLGALGGALFGGPAGMLNAGRDTQGQTPPPPPPPAGQPPAGQAPNGFPDVPEFPTTPAVPAGPRVPPFTPLRTTPEGELERDLFGVVPQGRAVNPREMIGPEMPGAEEIAKQIPMNFPGQQELFVGPSENAPNAPFTPEPKAPEAKPVDIPATLKGVVDAAKQDPNAPKLLKANNPATAKIVAGRIEALMGDDKDPIKAIEQLYTEHKTGKGKGLTDAQQELLEHTYHQLTGRQVEEGIKERAFLAANQADFFAPTGEPNVEPTTPPSGEAGPNVGAPVEPNGGEPAGGAAGVEPSGVAPSPMPPQGPAGGTAAQPTALTPEQAWENRRDSSQPTFGELDPEEQAAWAEMVARGKGTGVNFAKVMAGHTIRTAKAAGKSEAEVKEAFKAHGKAMSQDIETEITGKNFNQVLQLLTKTGPEANREIAKRLMQRAKELVQHGYSFKFHVATTVAQAQKAKYGYGVLGRVQPDYFRKHMDISVAGANSGQPFGAQIRTVTHESTHAVTAMMVEYGERNPTSEAGKIVKELTKLSNDVRKHLEAKVARGEQLTPAEEKTLNRTNALGNSTGRGRYNQAHEMLAHGMTSEFMQEVLESIPYKGRSNLFSHFVDLVRQLLGVNAREKTALSQVIRLTEGLLDTSLAPIKSQTSRGRGLESSVRPEEITKSKAASFWKAAENIQRTEEVENEEDAWKGGVADFGDRDASTNIQNQPGYYDYISDVQQLLSDKLLDGKFNRQFYVYRYGDLNLPTEVSLTEGDMPPVATTLSLNFAKAFKNFAGFDEETGTDRGWMRIAVRPGDVIMLGKEGEQELVINPNNLNKEDVEIVDENFQPEEPTALFSSETPWAERETPNQFGRENALTDLNRLMREAYDESNSPDEAYNLAYEAANPAEQYILRQLKKDDFLGFDYPHQAVEAILQEPGNYDLSPALKTAISRLGNKSTLSSSINATAAPMVVPGLGQPYTLPRGSKLAPAQTAGQKTRDAVEKATKSYKSDDFWTKFRIAAVDQFAGLSKTLSSLPVFANGKLRADMLLRSATQTINLIKNGLQSGIPVLNGDGTVVISRSADNLARTQRMADGLDNNAIVKGTKMTGREYVGEVARHLRGEEIINEDKRRRTKAAVMMGVAKQKMADAKILYRAGGKFAEVQKLVREAKAIRAKFRNDVNLNREKQTTQAHIDWAKQQVAAVPELQQIFDTWRNINLGLIQLWQDSGKLNQEDADRLRSFKSYVPLYAAREDLAIDKQEGYTGARTGTKTVRGIEYLEGSELQRNIWENWDKHYASMTAAAFVNQTRKVAVEQLKSLGAARISGPSDENVNLRYEDVNSPDADKEGIVHAIVDNPNDLAAFQAMHYELTPLMKAMSAATQGLRVTALVNPMYWIKQLIRDPLHAALVTNTGITTPFHSASEFAKVLAGQSEEAKLLATRGVIGQVDSTIDINDFLKQAGTQKLTPSGLDRALHKIMQIHEASDAATRVALFKKAKADGLKKGMSEKEAIDYGVFVSRESINFGVRGNSRTLAALRHMIPFLSASITSLDTLYRAATGYGLNPQEKAEMQRIFYSRAAMMTVLATAYAMSLQDDDDYKKLPANVKDNNWLMPNPWSTDGHSFIKVPVPFEIGFFFKTLPEAAVRYLTGNATGKEMLTSVRLGIMHNLPGGGILIPQAVKPGLEAVVNYSFFTGRAIEGMSDQGLPVAQRGPNASEAAKLLSKMGLDTIGLSPAKIDHLIQGYMAELGTFTSSVAGDLLAAAEGKTPPTKNIEEQAFFKSFMTNPKTSSAATDFYEIAHTAQETVTDFNRAVMRGDREHAMELMSDEEKKKLYAIAPVTRSMQNQMNLIRKRVNYIKDQNDRDPDERRDEINKLMRDYHDVANRIYGVLEKAGIER